MATAFAHTSCPKCSHAVMLVFDDDVKENWQYTCAGNGMYGYGFCGTTFEIREKEDDVDE